MNGGVFVGRPTRTCICGWACPKKLNVILPEGITLGVGDLSYVCPSCDALIWEGGAAVPLEEKAPSEEVTKKEETP